MNRPKTLGIGDKFGRKQCNYIENRPKTPGIGGEFGRKESKYTMNHPQAIGIEEIFEHMIR